MTNEEHEYQPETNYEYQLRQTDEARKRAYADPQTGSDRLFAEAQRMDVMGEEGFEEKQQQAVDRYNEIKSEIPWPAGE